MCDCRKQSRIRLLITPSCRRSFRENDFTGQASRIVRTVRERVRRYRAVCVPGDPAGKIDPMVYTADQECPRAVDERDRHTGKQDCALRLPAGNRASEQQWLESESQTRGTYTAPGRSESAEKTAQSEAFIPHSAPWNSVFWKYRVILGNDS